MGCHSYLQVYIGNLVGGLVTEEALRQLFNNTMAAAFPDQVHRHTLSILTQHLLSKTVGHLVEALVSCRLPGAGLPI